jgi:antitoxin ParD1/3/4
MTTVELAISDEDHRILQRRASEKGFISVSEYLIELARKDHRDAARERIDSLLLEGLNSGDPIPMTEEWWEKTRQELRSRLEAKVS